MNKVELIGRICHDLELKATGEHKCVRFSIAVNRRVKKEDGTTEADFISCVAWNKSAQTIVQYFKKGHRIGLTGHIQTSSYTRQDGSRSYSTDVIVEEFDFLEKKSDERPAPQYEEPKATSLAQEEDPFESFGKQVEVDDFRPAIDEDDLPF